MNNQLVNFIVKKYLKWDKTNPYISISAVLAFIGVSVGVMVLLISMAIMNGTAKEFAKKLFTMNYPLTVFPIVDGQVDKKLLKRLEKKYPKLKFSPYLKTQAIIQNGEKMSGGLVYAVDIKKEKKINKIFAKTVKNTKVKKYDTIIGKGVEESLRIFEPNTKVTFFFSSVSPTGLSQMPKVKRFRHIKSFKSGLNAYDNAYIYVTIDALRAVLGRTDDSYDGIHIYSKTPFEDKVMLLEYLKNDGIGVVGWWQQNGNLFAAMQMEKKALMVVLMLIVLIASLNIISSLLMTVMSRRKEIALLISQGASKKEIKMIFLRLGTIIGFGGIALGVALGFLGIYVLENYDIIKLPADVYGTTKLPLKLATTDLLIILFGSSVVVYLSALYPSVRAGNLDIIDILKNE
ncbi:MAG: ABC transporter permease [Epsilonproteobacteria bacterium]|nr:MAG: ABC transporter permease [Campylobacterota bacterium]